MIPTAFGAIRPSNFQRYWWLRSPYTDLSYVISAYFVTPSGDVGYNPLSEYGVSDSYGRIYFRRTWYTATLFYPEYWWLRSTYTFFDTDAWYVRSDGDVVNDGYFLGNSYGCYGGFFG